MATTRHDRGGAAPRSRALAAALTVALALTMLAVTPPTVPSADAAGEVTPRADFEAGFPAGWFVFNGPATAVTTVPTTIADSAPDARPGQVGDNTALDLDYSVGDFGGFGVDVTGGGPGVDLSGTEGVSFWFKGENSGLTYQFEISENRSDPNLDTSERWDVEFTDDSTAWRRIEIPWSAFTRATDFQPGGAPDDGLTLTEVYAWAVVLPFGASNVLFDDIGIDDRVVIDFEDGFPPSGTDTASGVPLGFFNFQGAGSTISIGTVATPPAPVLFELGPDNQVMDVTMDVGSFAGFIHTFADESNSTWTPRDWSAYEGFAFWFYGQGTGTTMFVDLLENRNPGSTSDDAERLTLEFTDDTVGWRHVQVPFADITHKEIGNGAPNDGFTGREMHGWALGALNTPGEVTWYVDGVSLYGRAGSIPLATQWSENVFSIEEGETGQIRVRLNRPMVEGDDPVTVDYSTEPFNAIEGREYTPVSGSLTFEVGGPQEQAVDVTTFEDDKFEGDERVILRLSDPVNATLGTIRQASILIRDDDPFDPLLLDDFERYPWLFDTTGDVALDNPELVAGAPAGATVAVASAAQQALPPPVPGQGDYERVLQADVPYSVDVTINGAVCNPGRGVTNVVVHGSESLPVDRIDHTTLVVNGLTETQQRRGEPVRRVDDVDGDGVDDLIVHVRVPSDNSLCDGASVMVTGMTNDGRSIGTPSSISRTFAGPRDWTDGQAVSFWWHGAGTGDRVTLEVLDNEAPDPGPDGWEMVWSDEFDAPAGTPPSPENWGYEIGDVTPDGKNGWGNEERQYYTDSTDNVRHDGDGNLEIVLREAAGDLECYYGTCEYTSGRLLSWHRAEFQYGRIESRVKVPEGSGLWPAVWSLGTDIDYNPWPGAGEIDIMEYVGRLPNEIFGTIHGPGYSGGQSFGSVVDTGEPVFEDYHTYAVEWQPDLIRWYFDGELYHTATPADVAPNPWVFDKPFFLLLNQAIGGNFGGTIDPDIGELLPATTEIDYVRVYQAPDTAERFEASFVDDVEGWREVTIPFTELTRSEEQPAGAPDDGLSLDEVNGYGLRISDGIASGRVWVDEVRVDPVPPPTAVTATSAANSGPGSLRASIDRVADGGTVSVDPSLAGETVSLSGPIVVTKDVTIDAAAAPGFTLDGQGVDRVLVVDPGAAVTVTDMTMRNGYGFQLAGGILNNGDLTLERVTVVDNVMTTDAGDFWQGGGGVYTGDGGSLTLVDSTVADNDSGWTGAGVYSFFNTQTTVVRSTISGNVASDIGGGIRALGDLTVDNSTISGNTSTPWHGGAVFLTDGTSAITNTTIADNSSAPGTSDVFVGTFTDASAFLSLTNSIVTGPTGTCFLAPFGSGAVGITSGGNNIVGGGCGTPTATDQVGADPLVGPLADNGGPTLTHALLPGSPAIDAADTGVCPVTDQRGVARDAACDIGSYEFP